MTLIPDFGKVSTDSEILNLLHLKLNMKKRQFFNERTDYSILEKIYSTAENQDDLINATKISGRTNNGLGFNSLNAITNKNQDKPLTNYNVMILINLMVITHP